MSPFGGLKFDLNGHVNSAFETRLSRIIPTFKPMSSCLYVPIISLSLSLSLFLYHTHTPFVSESDCSPNIESVYLASSKNDNDYFVSSKGGREGGREKIRL